MKSPMFTMWADMSDRPNVPNLKKQLRIEEFRQSWSMDDGDKRSVLMDPTVERFRILFYQNMEH